MQAISEQRIRDCLEILNKREDETEIARERLERLSFQLVHLLDEIEEFRRVVYCKGAAACWLENDVLRVLSGSLRWNGSIEEDTYFGTPSAASNRILGQSSNGWIKWKDSRHRSMKELSGRD